MQKAGMQPLQLCAVDCARCGDMMLIEDGPRQRWLCDACLKWQDEEFVAAGRPDLVGLRWEYEPPAEHEPPAGGGHGR